jgi:hypothetical protein
VFFRCQVISGILDDSWQDPEQIVERRRFFSREELQTIRLKPDSLPGVAFDSGLAAGYDALELLVKAREDLT